ncbi:MAG: IS481 family transposase [Gemmatimonadaceae bacterium]
MQQRTQFLATYAEDLYTMTELCARFGISRKTGYKWLARFDEGGRRALEDRSRAPHGCPHRIAPAMARILCAARRAHPDWGPVKLLAWLRPRHPARAWPAPSTVGDLLAREGLVTKRRRRRPHAHPGVVPATTAAPNDLWTADFKGQFPTQDGVLCYPLTIADQHTRFLLTCEGVRSTHTVLARPVFERAFRHYGLPHAIRIDNGVPFATNALHGRSDLNVWWLRLGIQHQRIHPGCPQENGAHERMHRTLKRGAIRPPRANLRAQQRAFDAFRTEYNTERPHTYLEDHTPASRYAASPRAFPPRLPTQEYPGHYLVKHVTRAGTIRFRDRLLYLANALAFHHVGLEETEDGIWSVYFNTVLLAKLDERDGILRG